MLDAERVENGEGGPALPPMAGLSARESQVLEMASRGLTNLEIAAGLGLSVHAVKFHLAGVYRKLGVHNRTEAVVLYIRAPRTPGSEASP
jgi:DNA-binding CsgD family transcriptional regulator